MLPGVLALIGFTAVTAQIVLIRELMVVFCGTEMSLGIMLASWLLWTAIGSGVLGGWVARRGQPRCAVAILDALAAIAFPLTIFLARASKPMFQAVPGEVLGPGPMLLTSLLALSVFCVISGGLFAAGSRLYQLESGSSTSTGTSRVYLFEAIGSGLGGILASMVLIRHLPPMAIAGVLSLLNFAAAVSLTIRSRVRRVMALGALAVLFGVAVFPFGCTWAEHASLARLWGGFHLVAARNSVYGNLVLTQTGEMRSLFENGLITINVPDPSAAEESVHFALLEHPSPKSLLLVGGGMNGSLAQALQHTSLERVDYVELDPAILSLAQEYFPREWEPVQRDDRVHVHNMDGRLFLKRTESRFDVVIVNLPDPQTAQVNRFYTKEFFREAASKLNGAGVFSFSLRGAEDYISPELSDFLRCIEKTLREAFPEVVTIPGETVHFLAAKQTGILTADPGEFVARMRARDLHTSYLREYYIPYRLTPDRMADLETQLRPRAGTRVNRDFAPVAYYFDVTLWSSQFGGGYRRAFQSLGRVRFGTLLAVLALGLSVLAASAYWPAGSKDRTRLSAGFCVATMGFSLIGLEMVLLLAFQAIYGYVYQQLAIIIAGFMAGMALGSWRGIRSAQRPEAAVSRVFRIAGTSSDSKRLAGLQLLAALSPFVLYALLEVFTGVARPWAVFLVSQVVFPLVAVVCGLLGGYQFPIASRIFYAGSNGKAGSPGALYALDLAGACVGAVVLSTYLVPVFGFYETAWLMAVVNLVPGVLMGFLAFGSPASPE